MTIRSVFRFFLKILLIIIGVLAFSILVLHISFVNNARTVLQQIVAEKSGNRYKLSLSNLSFDFISKKLQIRVADLRSTDSLTEPATYHVRFRRLTLHIHSFWPLIMEKKLLLDSIKLDDPVIAVTQWRKDTSSKWAMDDLSIPKELGNLYNSMLNVLDAFEIKRIFISNATVSLVNKMKPDAETVSITNIYLDVFRTADNALRRDEYIPKKQSVGLRIRSQDIALPGGRHHISFKTFTLQLFRRRIEMDSCTITALATGDTKSNYKIFFSKLLLIGVDVNAMYDDDVIRADSVYCENPLFNINIIVSDTGSKNKGMPDPEKIIRDLTGNLDLGFVGVKNAGIKISISGSKERSLFNSNKDNFIMRGLRVNADSSEPVVVQKFDMLVRDYRLYNEDSTVVYGFDSVAFSNNKVALNNFTVSTTSGRNVQRNERRYRIPYFELTGLDWYSLVFDERFKAKEAVLYSPVINYTKSANSPRKKRINLFTSLQTIDDLVTLDKINIVHGQINMKLDPSSSLNFHDVNLSLSSDKLLKSTNRRGLRKAIDYLSFSSGFLTFKDITARINNIRYTGSNLIRADKLSITSKTKKVSAEVHDVLIDNMLFDDNLESMVVDGLRWRDATIELSSQPAMQKSGKRLMNIELKNISGENTNIKFSTDKTNISGLVQSLKIASLSRVGNQAVHALGFFANGSDLNVKTNPLHMTVGAYELSGNSPSFLLGLNVERIEHGDSLSIKSPRVNFSVDINQILAGDLHVSNVEAKSPDIILKKWNTVNRPPSEPALQASISIDTIVVTEPDVYIASHRNDSVTIVSMPRSGKSNIKASAFALDKDTMKLDLLSFNTNILTVTRANGDAMGVREGSMNLELTNLEYWKKGGKPFWTGIIKSLEVKNPTSMGIGKNNNKLSIKELMLGNFRLSSDHLDDFRKVLRSNVSAWLRTATGYYVDNKATIRWYNAGYDNINKTFSLDSFSYHPTPARDSAIAHASHQFDYITFHSGPIHFKDFDLQKYRSDTSIIANTIEIKNPVVSIYRDKQLPFLGGVIKPLPVGYIRNINIPISVKRVNIRGGDLTYTEVNPNTKAEGTVFFTNINGALSNIKNRNFIHEDSLGLSLNAYFMDSAFIDLRIKESYGDSLRGFLMSLRMKPTSLTFLNPVLVPMANVTVVSGSIDSLQLRAVGRENIALGEMNMFYHNLRIKLVSPGQPDKTTFKTRLISLIANSFVIKRNNAGRTGLVYFERLRDRSFFNYIVKMTFSGLATSIGYRKNKKYMKKYRQALQDKHLPPIDFDSIR